MTKVALFDPEFFGTKGNPDSESFRFNVGLLSIGSYLKYHGINTTVYYKPRLYLKELSKIITPEVAVVGISIMSNQLDDAIVLAKKIKKIKPDLPIVAGGYHVRLFPEEMLKQKEFDIVVPGVGEIPMKNIFDTLVSGKSLRRVKGLGFKKDGKNIWTESQEDIDVKTLPPMDYSIMNNFSLIKWYDGQKSMYVYSGTGCSFNCTFCINSVNFRKFQQRKVVDVIDEIEVLIKEYGVTHVYPTDEFFCANQSRLIEFLDLIEKRKLHFSWFVQNRADTIIPERLSQKVLRRMKKLGCSMMSFGAESGSDEMLARMNKHLLTKQTENAVANLAKANIIPALSLIIGMPEETSKDYMATLHMIHRLKKACPNVTLFGPGLYRPIPGSLMYNKAMSYYPKGTKIRFSMMSEFASINLPNSLQAKTCNYRWIQDKKLLYDILVCIERFYFYPSLFTTWMGFLKAIFLAGVPNFLVSKVSYLNNRISKNSLENKYDPLKYYLRFYSYFIYYLFPWWHKYLLNDRINPEAFSPFIWFKWKLLLRRAN